ncbi:protein HIRA-like [Tropilaelaps mercedesae]|uniref:Protein HIRA-like n=1 Tax=Tropilaelaps mercedesae TaxID=418985 RepID=A0A1V9XGN1_9ACAR|nr:protein HIRA-like [Tropilaelaps mercedesae]
MICGVTCAFHLRKPTGISDADQWGVILLIPQCRRRIVFQSYAVAEVRSLTTRFGRFELLPFITKKTIGARSNGHSTNIEREKMVKLFKPSWVNHDGNPIFSVDVHPDGSRFATGGQGQDCGQVCIWNMGPVIRADEEKKDSIPKLFCQLTNHLACVNCVRWSHDGRFLASAGDDKTVIIWQIGRTISGPGSYGAAFGKANVEQWRTVACLKGHDGDILHVAWSPASDEYIASCSVDTTVVVWSTRRWHERVAVLRGHQGFVKGVCWDPLGKYVATQSDDKTVRLWRTHDWQQECVISAPFEETGGTTHVLRLSWSPDGQYVVSAHAMNNGGPTAQIIERGGWRTVKDFVGHRRAVTVARFFPSILKSANTTTTAGDSKPISDMFNCLAIGSRDRSVSIWRNDRKRALCVVHDLFTNSVVDLSWNPLTQQLLACSSDGSLAVLDFSSQELGKAVSQDEQATLFQRLYGLEGAGQAGPLAGLGLNNLLVENVDVLKAHEKAKTNGVAPTAAVSRADISQTTQSNASIVSSQRLAKGPTDRQIETILPDGRRRITPLYIPLDSLGPDGNDAGLPLTFSSSRQEKSKIVVEKRDNSSCSFPLPPVPSGTTTSQQQTSAPADLVVVPNRQVHATIQAPQQSQSQPALQQQQIQPNPAIASNAAIDGKGKPKRIRPTLVSAPISQSAGANGAQGATAFQDNITPTSVAQQEDINVQQRFTSSAVSNHQISGPMHLPVNGAPVLGTQIYPALQLRQPCVINIEVGLTVHIMANIPVGGGSTVSRVVCTKVLSSPATDGAPLTQEMWETVIEGRACAAAASVSLTALVDSEGHLILLCTRSGRRLASPLVLSALAAMITCRNRRVAVLTVDGLLTIFEVSRPDQEIGASLGTDPSSSEFSGSVSLASLVYGNGRGCYRRLLSESVRPVLSANQSAILRSLDLIQPQGFPLLSLSNGRHYVFDQEAASWGMISCTSGVISRCSDHYAALPPEKSSSSTGPLERIQGSLLRSTAGRTMSALQANPSIRPPATLAFLEGELNGARVLSSPKEFHFWALALVRFLAAEGLEGRLRLALDDIIAADGLQTDTDVSSVNARQMLADVLPVIAGNLRLQRVYLEYKQRFELLERTGPHGKLPRVSSLRARQDASVLKTPRPKPPLTQQPPTIALENGTPSVVTGTASKVTSGSQSRKRGRPPKNRNSVKNARLEPSGQKAGLVAETAHDGQNPPAINGMAEDNKNESITVASVTPTEDVKDSLIHKQLNGDNNSSSTNEIDEDVQRMVVSSSDLANKGTVTDLMAVDANGPGSTITTGTTRPDGTGGPVGRVLQGVLKAIEREEREQRQDNDDTTLQELRRNRRSLKRNGMGDEVKRR